MDKFKLEQEAYARDLAHNDGKSPFENPLQVTEEEIEDFEVEKEVVKDEEET